MHYRPWFFDHNTYARKTEPKEANASWCGSFIPAQMAQEVAGPLSRWPHTPRTTTTSNDLPSPTSQYKKNGPARLAGPLAKGTQDYVNPDFESWQASASAASVVAVSIVASIVVLPAVLDIVRPVIGERVVDNGSDYLIPAIAMLNPTARLLEDGYLRWQGETDDMLARQRKEALDEIYSYNPVLFDFVLKRTIRVNGLPIPAATFYDLDTKRRHPTLGCAP